MVLDHATRRREQLLDRYIRAFDTGDLAAIGGILAEAEVDPELDRQLVGVNEALYEAAGLPPAPEVAAPLRRLLADPLPSAFPPAGGDLGEPALTVGEVAARLRVDRAALTLPAADRLANERLIACATALPETITAPGLARLAATLGAEASPRYWEVFRRVALLLKLSASAASVGLAARQRRGSRRQPPRRELDSGQATPDA